MTVYYDPGGKKNCYSQNNEFSYLKEHQIIIKIPDQASVFAWESVQWGMLNDLVPLSWTSQLSREVHKKADTSGLKFAKEQALTDA